MLIAMRSFTSGFLIEISDVIPLPNDPVHNFIADFA